MTEQKKPDAPEAQIQLERRRRELWIYMAVSITAVEILILVGALFFGFISGHSKGSGQLIFPWLSWGAVSLFVPAMILLGVHLAGVGLFNSPGSKDSQEEWQKHLPEKLQKAYRVISRAPAVVLVAGIAVLAVAIFTLDGAITALESFLLAFRPYLLHILAGVGGILLVFGLAAVWLNYRTRRLYAEYEYRREVLQKTGLVIVDKKSLILQPGAGQPGGYLPLEAASAAQAALPEAQVIDVEGGGAEHVAEDMEDAEVTVSPESYSAKGTPDRV